MVAIGDVHGEYEKLRSIFLHAKLIDPANTWTGGGSVFVQTGDVIDRGPKSFESVNLIRSLQEQAQKTGGRGIRLFGNHELMLLQGDHRYVNFQKPFELSKQFRERDCQRKTSGCLDGWDLALQPCGCQNKAPAMVGKWQGGD